MFVENFPIEVNEFDSEDLFGGMSPDSHQTISKSLGNPNLSSWSCEDDHKLMMVVDEMGPTTQW